MNEPITDLVLHYEPELTVPADGVTAGFFYVWSERTGEVHSVTPAAAVTLDGQTHYTSA